jgi:Ca2+-binding EF-hand superfamily protein
LVDAAHVAKGSTLQRGQVHDLLTELNEGIKVSWEETDWAIETADVDGNGELDREELRAAVSWW